MADGAFDAVIAAGVLPHVANDRLALKNMAMLIREGGHLFVEFRNKLFSLFTFNRYTKEFILDDLLAGVPRDVTAHVAQELESALRSICRRRARWAQMAAHRDMTLSSRSSTIRSS